MNTSILTVGSVTLAVKARRVLDRAGIRSRLVKTETRKTGGGCRYGVQILRPELYRAAAELRGNGIFCEVYPEG